jgi:hypothetical protein
MGTVTITSAGFGVLPAGAPPQWPSGSVNWPAGGSINGTKAFTINDADVQSMLAWIATNYSTQLVGSNTPPVTVSAIAIVLAWLQGFMQATTDATQRHHTTPPQVPPPITIS